MIDFARPPYDAAMCEYYSRAADPQPLETFDTLKKTDYSYTDYYEHYVPDESATVIYHELETYPSRDYYKSHDQWKPKEEVGHNDAIRWLMDTVRNRFSDYDIPYYKFANYTSEDLTRLDMQELYQMMIHPNVDPQTSKQITEFVYGVLHSASPLGLYDELDSPGSLSDGRSSEDEDRKDGLLGRASPGSQDERPPGRRPPGRPKGTGRKVGKRQKNVSVPEFLRDTLLDARHCPEKMCWEDYSKRTFRFKKPDQVAKLWGDLKGNTQMTFEKFSRAMRYHYKSQVLCPVPANRLVYQFGPKGPETYTDNPNFDNNKPDPDRYYS